MAIVKARLKDDGRVVKVTASGRERSIKSGIDWAKVNATTEADIARQIDEDDAEAQQDAAAYARGVRERFGVSQEVFAERLGVSPETVRSWEQGRRSLKGPAKALLRFMDREPAAAKRTFRLGQLGKKSRRTA